MNRIHLMPRWLAGLILISRLLQPLAGQGPERAPSPDRQREPYFTQTRPLTPLSFSGSELIDHFNRNLDRVRLVLILSPGNEEDLRDAAAVERFLQQNAQASWKVLAVWTAARPTDSVASSLRATSVLSDQRVEHFYDASGWMARSLALRLGYPLDDPVQGLFIGYPIGASWNGLAPRPSFWMHRRPGLEQGQLFSLSGLEQAMLE